MRDPQRIRPLLNKLESIWVKYPDFRLGQLLINALREPDGAEPRDLWNMEDEVAMQRLTEFEQWFLGEKE